ncbi:NeuD/PglB/VioB family sugar acetyltransferase (plasmid) [Coraliomargarita sp. W4R53]
MSGVLLVGASGLAREVLAAGITGVVGIVDDDASLHDTTLGGVSVVGSIESAADRSEQLLVCVGAGRSRRDIVRRLRAMHVDESRFAIFVARSAQVGNTSEIARGSILLGGVVVTADATIGEHVVVMPNCSITHDGVLEDFVTLAAGVALGGSVHLGEASYVGMNAGVRQGVTIGENTTIGMGAIVLKDIPSDETWAGVPAQRLVVPS